MGIYSGSLSTLLAFVFWSTVCGASITLNDHHRPIRDSRRKGEHLNKTAVALFSKVKESFLQHYSETGRLLVTTDDRPRNSISLDFEVETGMHLQMTPRLLMLRGGIVYKTHLKKHYQKQTGMLREKANVGVFGDIHLHTIPEACSMTSPVQGASVGKYDHNFQNTPSLAHCNQHCLGTSDCLGIMYKASGDCYMLGRMYDKVEDQTGTWLSNKDCRSQVALVEQVTSEDGQADEVFPKVSNWFEVGLDGVGTTKNEQKTYRQQLAAQIEMESITMTPHTALTSSFLDDMEAWLQKLGGMKDAGVPAKIHKHLVLDLKPRNLNRPNSLTENCSKCHMQFTVGLPLSKVPDLLLLAPSNVSKFVVEKVSGICDKRELGCKPSYKGLLMLASQLVMQSQSCKDVCGHPKRCVDPWLVRTHFGDMAQAVARDHGAEVLTTLADDVLTATNVAEDTIVFPEGVVDYIKFPEMVELSGLGVSRYKRDAHQHKVTRDMPTTAHGLHSLAKEMLADVPATDEKLMSRSLESGCAVFGEGEVVNSLKARAWVEELLKGKDLMSDYDSSLSKASFSGMVWKSMGNWRMQPGSDRVYLECRNAQHCLSVFKHNRGPVALMRQVVTIMKAFEDEITEESAAPLLNEIL